MTMYSQRVLLSSCFKYQLGHIWHPDDFLLPTMSSATQTAHSFNKILNQPRLTSKSRQAGDIDEAVKKLRRLILVEGIPSAIVSLAIVVGRRYSTQVPCLPGPGITTSHMEDPLTRKPRLVSRDFPPICLTRSMRSPREDTE